MLLQGRLLIDPERIPEPGWVRTEGDVIVEIGEGDPPLDGEMIDAGGPECIICPGFIDAHLHLPQFDVVGCDGQSLMQWLDNIVYPAEMKWADQSVAIRQTLSAYRRMLASGTLGFAGYLTSHHHAVMAATKAAHQIPLRGIVGQVLMDQMAPSELLNQLEARLNRSEKGRLDTSLNPRFALACSERLLAQTGQRFNEGFPFSFKQREAGEMGTRLFLQTHLAETENEVTQVRELYPDDDHYAGVYDRHGLLSENTLLAHCLHLCDAEWDLIAKRDCVVVHCPGANTFLLSGVFDLNTIRERSIRLALGSDIAAGCDLAMPRVARSMIEMAKMRRMTIDPKTHVPSGAEAWTMITRGNADALGFHDMGRLEVGASADLLVLRVPFEVDGYLIDKLIHTWRENYISSRVLRGNSMHS
ncbi:MAG: amidohydrolase family protein [Planctomycetota bacterium]|nr:amidohydrolase family protein [Planctomycetota bacterium]